MLDYPGPIYIRIPGGEEPAVYAEDHNVLGGFGSRVTDVLMEEGVPAKVKKLGGSDCFAEFGYPEELYPHYGLDIDGIVKTALEFLK